MKTIFLIAVLFAFGCQKKDAVSTETPPAPPPKQATDKFIVGVDITYIDQVTGDGVFYKDIDGAPADPFLIFQKHGMRYVRIRVLLNPPDGWNSLPKALALATRAKAGGFKIILD